jgi:L-arabinonolactonase
MTLIASPLLFLPPAKLGEGLLADGDHLLGVDIDGQEIRRFRADARNAADAKLEIITTPQQVSFITLTQNSNIVIAGLQDGLYAADFKSGTLTKLNLNSSTATLPNSALLRLNDGKTSPDGRFLFFGSISNEKDPSGKRTPIATLYRLSSDNVLTEIRSQKANGNGVINANGLGWSPDGKTLYWTDTGHQTIFAFDYDAATGELGNERIFVAGKRFDGMTIGIDPVSGEYRVISAIYGAGCVEIYQPDGALDQTITVADAPNTTCPVLGGKDLRTLFIATAHSDHTNAGRIFAAPSFPLQGLPAARFAWKLAA